MEGSIKKLKVNLLSQNKYTDILEVDNKILEISYMNKNKNSDEVITRFQKIESLMKNKEYIYDNTLLVHSLNFFNLKSVLKILLELYPKELNEMFRYFSKNYIKESKHFDAEKKMYCHPYHIIIEIFKNKNSKIHKYKRSYLNRVIQGEIADSLYEIIEDEVVFFWKIELLRRLNDNTEISYIIKKLGPIKTLRICEKHLREEFIEFLHRKAEEYTKSRTTITYTRLLNSTLGIRIENTVNLINYPLISKIKEVSEIEYSKQYSLFVNNNYKELSVHKNIWKIYWQNGPSLNFKSYDFNTISSFTIRQEVKYYMIYRLKILNNKNDVFLETVNFAINYLTRENDNIKFFSDISDIDVSKLLAFLENEYITQYGTNLNITSIRKTIKNCGLIVDYLMSNYKNSKMKTPIPKTNYFTRLKFGNTRKYRKKTGIIDETIIEQVNKHIEDLEGRHQLMYNIFINTGLRMKEVVYLEEDCLKPSKYEGLEIMRYIPYKILKQRKKKNLYEYQEFVIPTELADQIRLQSENTKELRETYNTSFIFINKNKNRRAYITQGKGFVMALNRLTKKYGIKDDSGNIYRFTGRQFRKTLVVNLIEDGASTEEIAYLLGHLTHTTAKYYYEEVREMKLASMNTKFFKEKFDVIVSDNNLQEFSEKERRALYMDFRLEKRRVELGYCLKHYKDGPCEKVNRQINCANCEKLCTGKRYLSYWVKLREDQQLIINELIVFYKKHSMKEFKKYREFQQEEYLLKCYNDVIRKIENND